MQYILTTMSDSYPMIIPCSDGTFQILLESTVPFEFETGPAFIPGLRFGKKFGVYGVEYAGKEKRIQPLDWYILRFFNEHCEGDVPRIAAYLKRKGYKNGRTKDTSQMTRDGMKQIKKRIDRILRFLGCPVKVMRKKGDFLEIIFYGKGD